jgi:hypothetical protein
MSKIPFSENEIKFIVSEYEKGVSVAKLSKQFRTSYCPINRVLKEANVQKRNLSDIHKLYNISEEVFEKIDTEEKAYWLGMLYADGYNREDRGYVCLSLHEQDIDTILKFKEFTRYTAPIKTIITKTTRAKALTLYNQKISKDLALLGCVQAKTHKIDKPPIDARFYKAFILGYFDGDGGITFNKNEYNRPDVAITGNLPLIDFIRKVVYDELNLNFYKKKRHKERNNNVWTISLCGTNVCLKFLRWIYESSSPRMNRKYNKYLEIERMSYNIRNKNRKTADLIVTSQIIKKDEE